MTRSIWLASYPKSGNTWMRMLLANLTAASDKPVDINDLPERGGIASARAPFDYLMLVESGLLTFDEIDRLRPHVHEALARGEPDDEYDKPGSPMPVRFVKVHDAYTVNGDGQPLLAGARGADGAIVIVRDPRDVAPSLANHLGRSIDEAINFMNDRTAAFCKSRTAQPLQLRQQLAGWSGHVASWLDQKDLPVLLVRYEDMRADPVGCLKRVLAFAERPASDADIERAVRNADFSELRRQEQDRGFREAPTRLHSDKMFFRRGEVGAWREELSGEQIARIEMEHAPMMHRLGYATAQMPLARAG